jgi:ribosomal protein L5
MQQQQQERGNARVEEEITLLLPKKSRARKKNKTWDLKRGRQAGRKIRTFQGENTLVDE